MGVHGRLRGGRVGGIVVGQGAAEVAEGGRATGVGPASLATRWDMEA